MLFRSSVSALKFFDAGTRAFEAETGLTINEPGTFAVKSAVEAAVVEVIKEGAKKGLWEFKQPEKKDVVVPSQTSQAPKPAPSPAPAQTAVTSQQASDGASKTDQAPAVRTETVVAAAPAPVTETVTEAVAPAPAPLPAPEAPPVVAERRTWYLKTDAYLFKEPNERSQRTWMLKAGTELTWQSNGPDGWLYVNDAEKRKGFVRKNDLTDTPKSK